MGVSWLCEWVTSVYGPMCIIVGYRVFGMFMGLSVQYVMGIGWCHGSMCWFMGPMCIIGEFMGVYYVSRVLVINL